MHNLENGRSMDFQEDEDFPPLPPPLSPSQGGLQDDDEGEVSKLAEVPAAKRKIVRKPQPKLDSQRLTSERGLPALRSLFTPVRFKGRGHEAEDLRLLMQKMENWAHRLYPKLQFEDFMERVEKLGAKKDVQTCLKRIRLDMPLTHEDYADREGEDVVSSELQTLTEPEPISSQDFLHSTPSHAPSTVGPALSPPPAPPTLTEEQRRRMEENRRQALERRLARQQQAESQTVESQSLEPSATESPSAISSLSDHNEMVQNEEHESDLNSTEQLQPAAADGAAAAHRPAAAEAEAPAECEEADVKD